MLKKRIVATVIVKDGIVVQSIGFNKYLPVGKPTIALEFLNQWGIDEIILVDISASRQGREPDYDAISKAMRNCFVPLTVAGGITHINQVKELMHCGADKISLNQSAILNPALITETAQVFGNQCIVVSIDAKKTTECYKVYDYIKGTTLALSPSEWAKKAEELGAGEILIHSVDKDGSYSGYDLALIQSVCDQVSIPVIGSGGAKNARDFIELFSKTNVSAAAAANFFHFTEHSVNLTKAAIHKSIPIRLETYANYEENELTEDYRLKKKSDKTLEEMLFLKIEKEII